MSDFIARFTNVSKRFRIRQSNLWRTFFGKEGQLVLQNVTSIVKHGEKVALIGGNGSGKTTLLRLCLNVSRPTDGEIEIAEAPLALMGSGLGFNPELSGRRNVRNSMKLFSVGSDVPIDPMVESIEEFVELGDYFDLPIKTYSSGMRARLEFACLTSIRSSFYIIDEVMGAGDGYFSKKCAARMKRLLHGDVSLILVSHSLQQVKEFCDRAIWLKDGEVESEGYCDEVLKQYQGWQNDRLESEGYHIDQSEEEAKEDISDYIQSLIQRYGGRVADHSHSSKVFQTQVGGDLEITLSSESVEGGDEIKLFGLRPSFGWVWESKPLKLSVCSHSDSQIRMRWENVNCGIGEFQMFGIISQGGKVGDVFKVGSLQVEETNYSDPPLMHCKALVEVSDGVEIIDRSMSRVWGWV